MTLRAVAQQAYKQRSDNMITAALTIIEQLTDVAYSIDEVVIVDAEGNFVVDNLPLVALQSHNDDGEPIVKLAFAPPQAGVNQDGSRQMMIIEEPWQFGRAITMWDQHVSLELEEAESKRRVKKPKARR